MGTRLYFRCLRCGARGAMVKVVTVCQCGADYVTWPTTGKFPLRGWQGPCIAFRGGGLKLVAEKRLRRKKSKKNRFQQYITDTNDMFGDPWEPGSDVA